VVREAPQFTQSARIERSCGRPCVHDFVLRTESLEKDLNRALRGAGVRTGHVNVPVFNEVQGPARNMTFAWTCELLELVNAAEEPMFEEFGYRRRTCTRLKSHS
jgi:hypothetical protein